MSIGRSETWLAIVVSSMLAAGCDSDIAVEAVDPEWPPSEKLPAVFDFPPWLTMPEPNRIVVNWRTDDPSTGKVRFGTSPSYGKTLASTNEDRLHHVDLGELRPATSYYYEVEVDGTDARRQGVFTTPGAATWRFIHFGEFHAPSQIEHVALSAEAIREFRPHVIIESGDMVDDGDQIDHWRKYFQTSEPWISNVILLPTGSNHVRGDGGNDRLLDFFVLPNNERWYGTRWGNVQFFNLDSTYDGINDDISEEQPGWLAEQAALAHDGEEDPDFVVAAWHYPACSSSYSERTSVRNWVMENFIDTFLDNGGLDLALVGHDKYYERSFIEGGIVHVQSNLGRLAPGDTGRNREECTPMVTNKKHRSLTMISVEPSRLSARVLNEEGDELDSFVIER